MDKKRKRQTPTISLAQIYKDIVNQTLNEIPSEETGENVVSWTFAKNEKREIEVLKRNYEEDTAEVTIKLYTQDIEPNARGIWMKLKGDLKFHYERIAGGWLLTEIENLSFTYAAFQGNQIPQPPINNSNVIAPTNSVWLINTAFALRSGNHLPLRFVVLNNAIVTGKFFAQGGSGNDVKVYILNEDGYINFKNGHTVPTFYNSGQVTVGTVNVALGKGVYYLVFDNGYSLITNKAITANIELKY